MPDPVASHSSAANELIDSLREAAKGIKALGDEHVQMQDENDRLMADLSTVLGNEESAIVQLAEWRELLADFSRGIRDRDELIKLTIGR